MIRFVLLLVIIVSSMALGSCSGCQTSKAPMEPLPSRETQSTPSAPPQSGDVGDGEGAAAGFEEGGEMGPTDEIETPSEERAVDPSTETDTNE